MTVRSDLSVDWNASPRIIKVAAPSTDITVQDLYDTMRSIGAALKAIDEPEIIDGSGKDVLSATESVCLTVKLFNAKLKFEDRAAPPWIICDVAGGNLVAVDDAGSPMSPIEPANYVTVTLTASSSGTLIPAVAEWTQAEKEEIFTATAAKAHFSL